MSVIEQVELTEKLNNLEGWEVKENALVKEYEFVDFFNALSFVVKLGVEAEKHEHHPEILIHSFNKVKITLTTHSEGGITDKDFILADRLERI